MKFRKTVNTSKYLIVSGLSESKKAGKILKSNQYLVESNLLNQFEVIIGGKYKYLSCEIMIMRESKPDIPHCRDQYTDF